MDNDQMMEMPEPTETPQEDQTESPQKELIEAVNLAKKLDKKELEKIGKEAKEGLETDLGTVSDVFKNMEAWTKLAKQIAEPKTWPWPKASNIKYPLLSTAAMQFAARAYPSLLPSDGRVVKCRVIGKDPDASKTQLAEAVSIYMSYQILEEMEGWEEDMDRLLIMLPIVGTMFKKTYWDPVKEVNCSKLVLPQNLIVDYWAKDLKTAERITEIFEVNPRIVQERVRSGVWLDPELKEPTSAEATENKTDSPGKIDKTTPYVFAEQHTYLDLDKDDYPEPYIVTFHKETGKVVRIVARFDEDGIKTNEKGKVSRIEPVHYYTKYSFVPNPDGSFYDIGFGVLLGPLNESVNTLINQLVDSGTLNNLQSGFLGKGLRLRMGETKFAPGEWKVVNSTGSDLKQQIVPMPSKEPSKVLFELMGSLITSGKELASVAEIFVGKMPGQNTPATTTMATIEQGMKVFTAVYKRIYRSLAEEFQKLRRLNELYLNPNTPVEMIGMEINPQDFKDSSHKIYPGADPTAVSQTEKLLKAQGLMQLLGSGMPLNPVKVLIRQLEAQEQPNWQELIPEQIMQSGEMPQPEQGPDPKVQAMQAKMQMDQQAGQQQMAIAERQAKLDEQAKTQDLQVKQAEAQISLAEKSQLAKLKVGSQVAADQVRLSQAQQQHQQSMQQAQEAHAQQMSHAAQAAKQKGPTKK